MTAPIPPDLRHQLGREDDPLRRRVDPVMDLRVIGMGPRSLGPVPAPSLDDAVATHIIITKYDQFEFREPRGGDAAARPSSLMRAILRSGAAARRRAYHAVGVDKGPFLDERHRGGLGLRPGNAVVMHEGGGHDRGGIRGPSGTVGLSWWRGRNARAGSLRPGQGRAERGVEDVSRSG